MTSTLVGYEQVHAHAWWATFMRQEPG